VRCLDPRCEIQSTGERESRSEPEDATSPVRDTSSTRARQGAGSERLTGVQNLWCLLILTSVKYHHLQTGERKWSRVGKNFYATPSVIFRHRRVKGHRLQRLHHPACATIAFSASPLLLLQPARAKS